MLPMIRPTFRSRPANFARAFHQACEQFATARSTRPPTSRNGRANGFLTQSISRYSTASAPSSTRTHDEMHFQVSAEVQDAIATNRPIVALETTIYTHGFPYPDNLALALDLEAIVRRNGGIPATIGILAGAARVGLNEEELTAIASSAGKPETMKVSRRDLPYILGMGIAGRKLNGGTTIAGTMFLAQQAGIKVFGTGGLGGVHRGGQDTMDISADLTELGKTTVAVISSGCKSFLDIPRTLEYLETQGVGVFTIADGRTGDIDFPAFYTRNSGVRSPMVVQNPREAAAMIYSQAVFSHSSGLLFANPIPEEFSIPKAEIDVAIDQAVKEAAEQGFHGHSNTPFILARIKDLTKGNSIPANRALIESNVAMATQVAVELSALRHETGWNQPEISRPENGRRSFMPTIPKSTKSVETAKSLEVDILVFGSVAMDLSCDYSPHGEKTSKNFVSPNTDISPHMHTSNIATITPSIGGVGHNVTLAAHLASGASTVQLRSLVGQDLAGTAIMSALDQEGLDTAGVVTLPASIMKSSLPNRTAQYVAVNDAKKDLVLAMADMAVFSNIENREVLMPNSATQQSSAKPKWVVVDANFNPLIARQIFSHYKSLNAKTAFEPVSVAKSSAIFQASPRIPSTNHSLEVFPNHLIDLATPNQHELAAMHASAKKHEYFESDCWWHVIDSFGIPSSGARDRFVALTNREMTDQGIPLQTIQLLPYMPTILTKLGPAGVLLTELLKPDDARLTDPKSAAYILSWSSNGNTEVGGVYMRLFPAVEVVGDIVSVNGVGDTFLGVLIAGLAKGLKLDERLIDIAQRGAVMTLRSTEAVSPEVGRLKEELDTLAHHIRSI